MKLPAPNRAFLFDFLNMKVSSKDLFPTVYNEEFKTILEHLKTEYVNDGGRGSIKSTFTSYAVILIMELFPDVNALVVRKVADTLADSVFEQLNWAIDKLHLSNNFETKLSPLRIIKKDTQQQIIFRGADKPKKIKSIKLKKGYFGITWFEEVDEFTPNDISTIKLSTMRGGQKYWVFYSFNPPASSRNWVNIELKRPRADRYILTTNYTMLSEKQQKEWLGDAFLFEAEEMKRNNERAYRNIFLGEPTGTGSNVFENIELRKITDEEINNFEWIYSGIDFGYYPDSFRFVVFSYDMKNKTIYIFHELSLLKHSNFAASEKMKKFCEENNIDFDIRITGDSANPKDIADMREYGWNCRGAIKGKGSLEAGFKWLISRNKIVIDPERCPYGADEFSLLEYEIDKRTGELIGTIPNNQPDHTIAAMRYGTEEIWRNKGV